MIAPFLDRSAAGSAVSLAAALTIGVAFGWVLERAGLGNARKLAGQFYFTDFVVLKVMFSAVVTAMLGVFWLGRFGLLDVSRLYVPETWLAPQIVGGLIFGAGFVVAGLCPGTSCVAAATGRIDGLAVMVGMFAGVLATGLAMPLMASFYQSTALGTRTLASQLHASYGLMVALIACGAVAVFAALERMESARAVVR